MNRREFVHRSAVLGGGVVLLGTGLARGAESGPVSAGYPYALEPLPYAPEGLEPHIDAETMRIHHGRHHRGYVDKLNAALAPHPELQREPLEALLARLTRLPEALRPALRNQGGGHWNHAFFWPQLGLNRPASPALEQALASAFGSFDAFKAQFTQAALGVFGSGWVWLVRLAAGPLAKVATANQDNPLMDVAPVQGRPLLGLDVWEHAYYLRYQNRRADYLAAFWQVVNWAEVERRLG